MDHPFTYHALASARHIRVLTLAPSEDFDVALECSVDQLNIDDPIKEYEAISYTWGGQERTERLLCEGAIINITPNLASALLCLRHRTTPRRLWADAVCINQEDLTEKGQQIPLMARIFQAATQVRVWLGHGAEGESQALADLASMDQIAGPTRASLKHPLATKNHDPDTHQALMEMGRSAKKLLRMPWFTRRWIVQELVLNGNVVFHCGQSQISWQGLHIAFHALPDSVWDDELDGPVRRKLVQLRELWRTWCYANESTLDCGIYSLLHSFHDLECKEPKDKLYAIAALADDVELKQHPSAIPAEVALIAPDYEASDEQVFQDLAFKLIQSGKVFDTLAHAGATRVAGAERQLPSWVPDLRHSGPWPLIASERERIADSKPIELREYSNGILTLNTVVNCGWRPILFPDRGPTLDWDSLFVEDVFKPPKESTGHPVRFMVDAISNWLTDRFTLIGNFQSADLHGYFNRESSDSVKRYWRKQRSKSVEHMLWCIVRSQFLTEAGCESLGRLPSLQEWKQLYSRPNDVPNIITGDEWPSCLSRALSTRTIFSGLHEAAGPASTYCFGFGPSDLAPHDAIFVHSSGLDAVSALFLRSEGAEYEVIGSGLLWWCSVLGVLEREEARRGGGIWETRQIRLRLI